VLSKKSQCVWREKKYLVCKLVFSNAFGFCYLILAPLHSYFVRSQKSYVVGILACGYYPLMWNSIFPLEVNRDLAYMTRVGFCGSKFQLDWFNLLLHSWSSACLPSFAFWQMVLRCRVFIWWKVRSIWSYVVLPEDIQGSHWLNVTRVETYCMLWNQGHEELL